MKSRMSVFSRSLQSSRNVSQWATNSDQHRSDVFVSLERSVGARYKVDTELAEMGQFSAEVYPDLPIATSWGELFGSTFKR